MFVINIFVYSTNREQYKNNCRRWLMLLGTPQCVLMYCCAKPKGNASDFSLQCNIGKTRRPGVFFDNSLSPLFELIVLICCWQPPSLSLITVWMAAQSPCSAKQNLPATTTRRAARTWRAETWRQAAWRGCTSTMAREVTPSWVHITDTSGWSATPSAPCPPWTTR